MRIWKRLLGTALCLCAAVCVMSVSASAEGEHTEHPICGANHENIGDHTGTCEAVTWTAWNGTDEITYDADTKTAYVYLASDATRNNRLIVKTGCTLYLCLNGNSLTSSVTSSSDKNSEVINVPNNAKFILCDCKDSGTITHSPDAKGKGVRVGTESNPAATFSMYGGTISGNHADAQCWGSGGAGVEIHNGTFKMYGGTISDNYEENTGSNYGGGGVCAHSSGTFTMYGGTINNNHSVTDAGGVTVVGGDAMNMYGGTISGNTATGNGGGVGLWNNSFTLSGGTISGNTAKNDGGGVYFNGNTLTISDTVKIEGNSAANGGGVYLNSQDLSVTGGSIINNNATGSGGGVYFKGDTFGDTFNVSGHVSITGNKKGATSTGSGLIGGTDNNVYLPAGKIIIVGGALTGSSSNKIGVTTKNTPSASNYVQIASGNTDYAKPEKFLYENDGAIAVSAVVTGNTTTLVACQHNWSGEWTTNAAQHWKECSICKGKNDVSAHTYDQEVSEESYKYSDANCVSPARYYTSCVCGAKSTETFESGEINPDNHSGALGDWQSNEDKHWKEYSCCNVRMDEGDHQWDEGRETKSPTCTEEGVKTFTCSQCHNTKTEPVSATGHSWSDAWMHDDTHHWHDCENANCPVKENSAKDGYGPHSGGAANCTEEAVCASCGTAYGGLDANGHDWGEWEVKTPATETTVGSKTRTCKRDSNHTETETIPKLNHTHNMVHHPAVDADCGTGTAGNIEYWVCSGCGKFFSDADGRDGIDPNTTAIPPDHNLNTDWSHDESSHWHECKKCGQKPDSAAHEYDDGDDETCNICGYTRVIIPPHTHSLTQVPAVQATCVSAGNIEHYRCEVCGERFMDDEGNEPVTEDAVKIPPLGHDWQAATCETPKTCKRAGCSATEGGPLGHDWTTGWMSDADFHWHECLRENCGEKSGHAAHIPGPEATETAPQTCTECGYVIAPALEHTHVYDRQSTDARYLKAAAGCTTKAVYFCSCACGEAGTETFEAGTPLGHIWGRYIVTVAATQESEGVETRTCQRNDAHKQTRPIPKLPASTYGVSGEVHESGDSPAEGVKVTLVLGDREIASKTTDSEGKYSFGNVAPGVYNLVAKKADIIMTVKVEVISKDVAVSTIIMPQGKTNSVVEVKSDKSEENVEAVVGNLETVFKTTGDDKPFTDEDQNVVDGGGSVEIKLTVTKTDTKETSDKIEQELPADTKVGIRLELDVHKTVTPHNAAPTVTRIENTDVLLETIIRLPAALQGKDSYTVYRLHGTDVHTLTASPNANGEYIEVSLDKTAITIHAKLYSEYVIAYQERSETGGNGGNTGGTGGNTGNDNGGGHDDRDDGYTPPIVPAQPETHTGYRACRRDDACPIWPFADAAPTAWYHDGVHYCVEKGLMHGISADKFLPDGSTTRAQLVTILWRLEGSPETTGAARFSDVAGGAWYTEAVRWAAGCGVVKGYDNGCFGPNDAVTREQMAAILYRYAQHKGYDVSAGKDTNILSFDDAFAVSEYAIPAMQWACGSGMVRGIAQKGGMLLAPGDTTTRAQAATLIMRFQSAFAKEP